MHGEQGLATGRYLPAGGRDMAGEPAVVYCATLFDCVMDLMDRYDRMAALQQPPRNLERRDTSTT
jgi:hypothetical protein